MIGPDRLRTMLTEDDKIKVNELERLIDKQLSNRRLFSEKQNMVEIVAPQDFDTKYLPALKNIYCLGYGMGQDAWADIRVRYAPGGGSQRDYTEPQTYLQFMLKSP